MLPRKQNKNKTIGGVVEGWGAGWGGSELQFLRRAEAPLIPPARRLPRVTAQLLGRKDKGQGGRPGLAAGRWAGATEALVWAPTARRRRRP